MALPSQGGFSSSRGGSYRRRRKGKGFTWFVVLLVAVGATWLLWPTSSDVGASNHLAESGDVVTDETVLATPPAYEYPPTPTPILRPQGGEPVQGQVLESHGGATRPEQQESKGVRRLITSMCTQYE